MVQSLQSLPPHQALLHQRLPLLLQRVRCYAGKQVKSLSTLFAAMSSDLHAEPAP